MRDVQNITKMEGSVDKLLNESDKMIKEFIGRLEIMRDYCQSRIDEISEVCLGNLKNKDVWKKCQDSSNSRQRTINDQGDHPVGSSR